MNSKALIKQISILVGITTLFVTPYLFLKGTNIVTHTYAFGSRQFWAGLSPYVDPQGAGDWFKYSPLFAWFYTPFEGMNRPLQAGLWGIFNILCFWTGISLWFPWKKMESKWLWLGFLLCSMEADGSFRYQQMNASLVGLLLLGIYLYKEGKYFSSGVVLAIITNIKILPGLFLVGLLFPIRKKYLLGILIGLALCLLVPISVWGVNKTLLYHWDWYLLLKRDTQTEGLLDIATVLKRLGFLNTKIWILYPIALFSLGLFLLSRLKNHLFNWDLWISLGLFTLLLVNPRTESPTFVIGGPAYIFMFRYILRLSHLSKYFALTIWSLGVFFITLCMNDIWPKFIWDAAPWYQTNKTLGVFILWSLSIGLSLKPNLKTP